MAHLDLAQTSRKIPAEAAGAHVPRGPTMLLAAGIASFTIVGVAAAMMALLF
jgi:hypothetical protein